MAQIRRLSRALRTPRRLSEVWLSRRVTPDWYTLLSRYLSEGFNPFSVNLASGAFEFREKTDVATFWQVFVRGIYPVHASDRFIIDAGANIGTFTLYALLLNRECRVTAVEPCSPTFERLRGVLEIHQVASRCNLVNAALGGSEGETTIESSGPSQFRRAGYGTQPVREVTLASVMPRDGDVDLLKMDIEGSEYDTFESADDGVLSRIKRIVLEYHPSRDSRDRWLDLKGRLTAAGFGVTSEWDDGAGYGVAWLARGALHKSR